MTYGVPYSFVPGTKAKADEVNANFIDVLNKIEDTNLRIDETNSSADAKSAEIDTKFEQVEDVLEQRANLDLSNLSETGSAVLAAKAKATDLDGNWTSKSLTLTDTVTFSNTAAKTFSLSSYIPSDGRVYEVLLSYSGEVSSKAMYNLTCGFGTMNCIFVKGSANVGNMLTIPVSTARTITIAPTSLSAGTNKFSFRVTGYRKVR